MIKLLLISLCMSTLSISCYGQLDKGNFLFGGNLSLNANKAQLQSGAMPANDNKVSNISINPAVGFFLSDNLALGLNISLYANRTEGNNNLNQQYISKNSGYTFSPFMRYYKKIGDKFSLFGNVGVVGVGFGKNQNQNPIDPSYTEHIQFYNYSVGLNFTPGATFFINNKWGIETTFGYLGYAYNYTKYKNKNENAAVETIATRKSNDFTLNFFPSSFTLGIRYYWNR